MNTLDKLAEIFERFPGIGPRQARRFVNFLLQKKQDELKKISTLISELKSEVGNCKSCHRYFVLGSRKVTDHCPVCADQNRDRTTLMVISREVDLDNVEKSGSYNGKYFVLGGNLPILEKEPRKKIRADALLKSVEDRIIKDSLREVILALDLNPEGENTADFVTDLLSPLSKNLKITRLGRGLSTGTELEYSDFETLKSAIKNRG